jgi:hypothetical protein
MTTFSTKVPRSF